MEVIFSLHRDAYNQFGNKAIEQPNRLIVAPVIINLYNIGMMLGRNYQP